MTTIRKRGKGPNPNLTIANNAFVFLADLQAGIADLPLTVPEKQLKRNVGALLKLAKIFDLPTIVTAVPGGDGKVSKLLDEVEAARSSAQLLVRTTANSFNDKEIVEAIRKTERTIMLVSGVATEVAVQLPSLSAAAEDYDVRVLIDCCGGVSPRTEDAAMRRMVQAGVKISSVPTLIGELAGDFTEEKGQQAIGVLFELAGG